MSTDFDPYREWLSIPVSEQPANYYRLLGLPLFESDPNVISNAADRQMTFIRTFQMGKYSQQSQQILNELAAARVTLLDKQKKAEYDAKLRKGQHAGFHQSPSINKPVDSSLNNNNKKQSTTPLQTVGHTPSILSSTSSKSPSAPIAAPPSAPSNTPPIPSRTPLLTPSHTMSVPSVTPPSVISKAPKIPSITPPPPVPSSTPPIPDSAPPIPAHTPPSNNNDVPPQPSSRSKDAQTSSESKKSSFKKRWIAVLFFIIAVPLLIYGSGLLNNLKQNSQENQHVFKPGVKPGDRKTIEINGVEFAFRWCPPGSFTMGSPESEEGRNSDEMQHEVILTKGFWIMETEITVGMFKAFINNSGYASKGNAPYGWAGKTWNQDSKYSWRNPGFSQDDNHPVTCVSWVDAMEFCKWLSKKTGLNITLPTESQWEYACRAGSTTPYFWGDALNGDNANCDGNMPCGTTAKGAYIEKTTSICSYQSNAWGIYDMHGNVGEWCADWYGNYPAESVTDPTGSPNGVNRVCRGGSWRSEAKRCHSASRRDKNPMNRECDLGFRCVNSLDLESEKPEEIKSEDEKEETKTVPAQDSYNSVNKAGDRIVKVVNGVEFAFRWCPPGTFSMGSPKSEKDRLDNEKQHQVMLTKGFWMLETEVTQKQWQAIMGNNPSIAKGDDFPVSNLYWSNCYDFCKKFTEYGFPVRLPTEAQWEFACRAGSLGEFAGNLDEMAWYRENSNLTVHAVGTKKSNAWGLYDMYGNVSEWCLDRYEEYPDGSAVDPVGNSSSAFRVRRGGSYATLARTCRSACRERNNPEYREVTYGFRFIADQITSAPIQNAEEPVKPSSPDKPESEFEFPETPQIEVLQSVKDLYQLPDAEKYSGRREVITFNGVDFAFRWCPPGTFMMGSPQSEYERFSNEKQHQVTLTQGFWMLETEVTQKQWQVIMGSYHSNVKEENYPACYFCWFSCQDFCKRCTELGFPVRLPTEAQWEYACRAGTRGAFAGKLDDMAWHMDNSKMSIHPVGQLKPNAWGLYDMHGNVEEWCQDWYEEYPDGDVTDPVGPPDPAVVSNDSLRCRRGGCYNDFSGFCRSAIRRRSLPGYKQTHFGFRIVLGQMPTNEKSAEPPAPTSAAPGTRKPSIKKPVELYFELSDTEKLAGTRTVKVVNGVEFAFRWCPAGTFMMGSPESEEGRYINETQHSVMISKGFWMMETEVTQKQWNAIMGSNNSYFKGDDLPVEQVSWYDCQEFCRKCNQLNFPVILPTEAQWEYACRARSKTAYFWGNSLNGDQANCDGNKPCGTKDKGKYLERTTPVRTYPPNAWGLYDMHGNVMEWCEDWFDDYPDRNAMDPSGPHNGSFRVYRGGGWVYGARESRSAWRNGNAPKNKTNGFGFRCIIGRFWDTTDKKNPDADADPAPYERQQTTAPSLSEQIKRLSEEGKRAGDRETITINNAEFAFRWCPAGTFMMGSPESEEERSSNEVQHKVMLTKGFWMMETEVTQKQWQAVMGDNPDKDKGDDLPVTYISWDDCQEFCKKCKDIGFQLQLPTEAQWEYACRAGSQTPFSWGSALDGFKANCKGNEPYGTTEKGQYLQKITPVGNYRPNEWGLLDMHGNVIEWCQDWFGNYPNDNVTDPKGPSEGSQRVIRGGSFIHSPKCCRSAYRSYCKPDSRISNVGVRFISPITSE